MKCASCTTKLTSRRATTLSVRKDASDLTLASGILFFKNRATAWLQYSVVMKSRGESLLTLVCENLHNLVEQHWNVLKSADFFLYKKKTKKKTSHNS